MANQRFSQMRNRYARNKRFPVEKYRGYKWDGRTFLLTYVSNFYDLWMDAYAFGGATHYSGIVKLIHTLPPPWSQWVAKAAKPYMWHSPPEYTPRGDLGGLMGVLLPALAASCDGPPRYPPPPIFPPGQARLQKYRYDMEPHISRAPKRARLGIRTSTPPRMGREIENMLMMAPSHVSAEAEDEEVETLEEEWNPNRESVGETEEEEKEEGEI
ncbi:uncharacterized protein LOC125192489 [Salvia hispanica]|uniref:uncharacterized protein LOC125192489 n=1 Tax=Salvia hispanica TaxID=49212 RepID=UPI002009D6A7|nr:uncharacterized protein LOC125192489 [Salvia hispanica]